VNQQNKGGNGEDSRPQLFLKLNSHGRREMTATISMTALNDDQQACFDAEIEDLFAQLLQHRVGLESSNVQQ
jgi:hypothetical protein